jgi:hypothetical protein
MTLTAVSSSAWLYTYSILNETKLHKNKTANNLILGLSSSIVSDFENS